MYLPGLLDTEINYTMKEILQNWINFAEEFEKHLGQGDNEKEKYLFDVLINDN